jgi:adenine-specific DNA-methyltransferase
MLLKEFSRATGSSHTAKPSSFAPSGRLSRLARHSYGQRGTGNAIVQGDNLAVLDDLMADYAGKIRCVYIDPPYNNREKYHHYNDDLDHETWVRQIVTRVQRLHSLLSDNGSLWVSIDDSEVHYLKVAIDQIFGRANFVTTIVWQQRTSRENRKVFSNNHEYLLLYAKNKRKFSATRNPIDLTTEVKNRYRNPDRDPRGPWQSVSANVQAGHATKSQFYSLVAPNGKKHSAPSGRCWVYTLDKMKREIADNNVWFGVNGDGVPRLKKFLISAKTGLTPETLWSATEVGTTDLAKKHLLQLFPSDEVFDTPKPEQLIHRILKIATNPGEIVLDAYLGSGTTAAVAHKMERRYIGIEYGKHAVTLCAHRLKKVVDGEIGGMSQGVGWTGGGGFDFFTFTGQK